VIYILNRSIFRHELKYIISDKDRLILDKRLSSIMQVDENGDNGSYTIRSLYFDDIYDTAYVEKLAGTAARKKYRIRTYNYSDSLIKLERKSKRENYIFKESVNLTVDEYYKIINEDYSFLLEKGEKLLEQAKKCIEDNKRIGGAFSKKEKLISAGNLCRDFYVECISNKLRPRVYVDYERKTFVMSEGNVRITFDSNVRAGASHYDMFDKNMPVFECMQPEQLILEVKYTELYPSIVKDIISPEFSIFTAVSKFVLCCDKRMEMTR